MPENSLHIGERLKSRKAIERLFRTGRSYVSPPIRGVFAAGEPFPAGVKMTVAVPKRSVKRAVDRNLLKRRIREAYRLNKHSLLKALRDNEAGVEIIFIYQSSDILEFNAIQKAIKLLLNRVEKSVFDS